MSTFPLHRLWSLLFPWIMTRSKLIFSVTISTYLHFSVVVLYSVFNMTSLLLEAFNLLGFKVKPERMVIPLGFSELVICVPRHINV